MVKVIKRNTLFEVKCRTCKSELEANVEDVYKYTHYDYGGGSDTYTAIRCPVCKSDVTVNFYGDAPQWWQHSAYDGDSEAMKKRNSD